MLTHGGDGSGVGKEAPGPDGGETPAVEDAGSEAHHLLEALLYAPHPAALLKDHLAEEVILPEGEGGDEVGPVEGTRWVLMGRRDPQTLPAVAAVPVTHPCCRAMRTKPLRFFRMSVVTPGRQESDSAAPPMTMATALPVPFLDSRYPMARRVTGHKPAAERTTDAVGLPARAAPRDPTRDRVWWDHARTMQGTVRGCSLLRERVRVRAGCWQGVGRA